MQHMVTGAHATHGGSCKYAIVLGVPTHNTFLTSGLLLGSGCIPPVCHGRYHVGHDLDMPDCFLGTAQGEDRAAVGAAQLAEVLPHQLLVCLAGAVCKHKCALTVISTKYKRMQSPLSDLRETLGC